MEEPLGMPAGAQSSWPGPLKREQASCEVPNAMSKNTTTSICSTTGERALVVSTATEAELSSAHRYIVVKAGT